MTSSGFAKRSTDHTKKERATIIPVQFQFLQPQHIRRHHDLDLEKGIPGTRSIYSIRNTPNPLVLKVRKVPCLCSPCVKDNGEKCLNYEHTDPWEEVHLKPKKKIDKEN